MFANFRKFIALLVSVALIVGIGSSALAFQDVTAGSDYDAAVEALKEKGIVLGTGNDTFQPDAALTTAALVTLLGRIAGVSVDQTAVAEGISADGWSGGYMTWAIEAGLIGNGASQYVDLTAKEANKILAGFCTMQGVDHVTVTAAGNTVTRGEAAITLAELASAGSEGSLRLTDVKYTTITVGQDWNPAINKVILDLGVEVDAASVTAEKFTASSVRTVPGFDWATMQATDPAPQQVERTVTAAYVCNEQGGKTQQGTRVALEMKIGPDIDAGNPLNYDFVSGFNSFVETYYVISLTAPLTTADGTSLSMAPTDAAGNAGNMTLIADDFAKGSHTWKEGESSITLTYASWVPHEDAEAGSTPLIIWLHGAGEGGADPTLALIGNKAVNLATETIQKHFGDTGAEILVPQTPTIWLDRDGTVTYKTVEDDGRSIYTDALKSLIDAYVAEHPEIDMDRIYIGGCSNGGYMSVNMIIEYPEYFAAAYPVCEAYEAAWLTDDMISTIKDIPVWLTAAKTDSTVPIYEGETDPDNYIIYNLQLDDEGNPIPIDNYSNNLYNRLVAAGAANVHFSLFDKVVDTSGLYFQADGTTPYEYLGHYSWIYVLNDECVENINGTDTTIFQWLSQQSK